MHFLRKYNYSANVNVYASSGFMVIGNAKDEVNTSLAKSVTALVPAFASLAILQKSPTSLMVTGSVESFFKVLETVKKLVDEAVTLPFMCVRGTTFSKV